VKIRVPVYGLTQCWFGNGDGVLRQSDLPSNSAVAALWRESEQSVFEALGSLVLARMDLAMR
jgi:hypothetical protein